ncbi:carbohydrate ABC transporter permease [Paenibacillus paeoniae]|uniref:Carbohydrate ABC transporter permease n=1 Tax=Paenibacillus paeoniae TaxID=2292705 RepID=A0A371P5R7_9BACL|nr:carbohydrate ABC transporter permease [Paenibacillus paeoniae]REK71215.1 carbohydrate ABC transporter permease [Paenibacillus paeoniae]
MRLTKGEQIVSALNYIFLGLFALLALAPFVHVLAQSLSSHQAITSGRVSLWPVDFSFEAYSRVLSEQEFLRSFQISVLRTVVGTVVNVVLTCLLAYPLSKAFIKGRSVIMFLVVFSMMFGGGMIPTFLIVKETGLLNTFWAYIIPGAVSAFNVIIIKNFFQSVPAELEESAKIDGGSNLGILFRIVIPLSMPAIATITLFHAVGHWNSFFDTVLYVTDRKLFPLQVYLRELVMFNQSGIDNNSGYSANLDSTLLALESLKAAALIASTVPILIVYPFLQKYFVKGIMLGSVKG